MDTTSVMNHIRAIDNEIATLTQKKGALEQKLKDFYDKLGETNKELDELGISSNEDVEEIMNTAREMEEKAKKLLTRVQEWKRERRL